MTVEGEVSSASAAEAGGAEKNGANLIASLSPSRAMDFKACPALYRYRVVERLPEPASPAALRGTLVHAVLEALFDLPPDDRTPERAVGLLPEAWAAVREQEELADRFAPVPDIDDQGEAERSAWLASAEPLLKTYFALEDPRRYEPAARELAIETDVADGLVLRGIIDRLDESADGRVRVVDYKTGNAPHPDREARAMFQLRCYALMLWRRTGVVPSVLRLMYLGDGVILEHTPSEDDLRATERLLIALHDAIREAHETGRFDASPGWRCGWCSFAAICPSAKPGL